MGEVTSYESLARLVQQALQGSSLVNGAVTTPRQEVLVELRTGEAFLLSPMFLPPAEVDRLFARGENA